MIQGVLGQVERQLQARYGATTIVRIRRLAIRFDLDPCADPALAAELARDLVESVTAEIDAAPARLRPGADANVVVFTDEAHAIAAELADRASGITAWFHTGTCAPAEPWSAVVMRGPQHVQAVASWLERMECRHEVARWIERSAAPIEGE